MCIISGMPKPWFKVGKSSIQYPFVFYEGNMFLTFTISSAMVSRHDEKSIKIHSEGGHPKNRQVLCFSPTYNYKLPAKKKPSEFTLVMFRWDPHCQRQKKSLRSWGKLKCQSENTCLCLVGKMSFRLSIGWYTSLDSQNPPKKWYYSESIYAHQQRRNPQRKKRKMVFLQGGRARGPY